MTRGRVVPPVIHTTRFPFGTTGTSLLLEHCSQYQGWPGEGTNQNGARGPGDILITLRGRSRVGRRRAGTPFACFPEQLGIRSSGNFPSSYNPLFPVQILMPRALAHSPF